VKVSPCEKTYEKEKFIGKAKLHQDYAHTTRKKRCVLLPQGPEAPNRRKTKLIEVNGCTVTVSEYQPPVK